MFDHFSGETLQGTRSRLIASLASAGAVYTVLGFGAAAFLAHYATPPVEEEKQVEVKFVASAPPPPPPPPSAVVETAPPPPPPPKSRPPRPNETLPPPKPIEAPTEIPDQAPQEADPSQETGPPPAAEGSGEGDPFGQRGGKAEGTSGGRPGGIGSAPAIASEAPVILPAGATPPEPLDLSAKPEYPRAAIEARFTGEVVVKVIVRTDGGLDVVKIIKSDPNFDTAVLTFLKTYRMKPAMYNGKPVAVYRLLKFPFKLD